MKIKGTAVKTVPEFVKKKWPDRYDEWMSSLPRKSQTILKDSVYSTYWYSIDEAVIVPTEALKMFFDGDADLAAWEAGRYSAEVSLSGVYKIFVKLANPGFIIDRSSKIIPTYYENAKVDRVVKGNKSVKVVISNFETYHRVLENRIAGWMERALELSGCKNIEVDIPSSMLFDDKVTEIVLKWK